MFGATVVLLKRKYPHPVLEWLWLGEGPGGLSSPSRGTGRRRKPYPAPPPDQYGLHLAVSVNTSPSLLGPAGNTTASPPSSVPNPESSAATLKPEPSLASPPCPGPSVASQVRQMGWGGCPDLAPEHLQEPWLPDQVMAPAGLSQELRAGHTVGHWYQELTCGRRWAESPACVIASTLTKGPPPHSRSAALLRGLPSPREPPACLHSHVSPVLPAGL